MQAVNVSVQGYSGSKIIKREKLNLDESQLMSDVTIAFAQAVFDHDYRLTHIVINCPKRLTSPIIHYASEFRRVLTLVD